ncbi:DUF6077 domain-containing protein [Culicoidibacter larvae]|uniref:YfhO family protein n=1 Tax=Culicoidibacter larvae TaxID=2579976 RepID=A0A5R8QHD5_9FIRM|nr:DUF6077 domain-containing protein [Culicoidibacter larvae]TLG77451.1 YfhO family protein [Culicoidibacter larvae]
MIGFIFLPIIFFILYGLGNGITSFLDLKVKHKTLYGFIILFVPLSILMSITAVLHLSWPLFSILFSLILFVAIVSAGYFIYKLKLYKKINLGELWGYVKSNYFLWLLIILIIGLVIFDIGTVYWDSISGSNWDDYLYGAKALKAIGSSAIFSESPSVFGVGLGLHELIPSWELFTSYFSSVFSVAPALFNRLIVPFFTVPIIMFSLSEFLYQLNERRESKYHSFWLIGLACLILTMYGFEFNKLLTSPWFGNVLVTVMYLPLIFSLFFQSIKNKKALWLWILLPIAFLSFSSVMLLYSAISYIVLIFIWNMKKQYEIKIAPVVLIVVSICCLVAIGYSIWLMHVPFNEILSINSATEQLNFIDSIRSKTLFLVIALLLFVYRVAKNKASFNEKLFVGFMLAFICVCAYVPIFSNILFNLMNFPFRRFLESLLILLMAYSGFVVVDTLFSELKVKYLIPIMLLVLVIVQDQNEFPITTERYQMSTVKFPNLMSETVNDIAEMFDQRNSVIRFVTVADVDNDNIEMPEDGIGESYFFNGNNLFLSTYYSRYIDIGDGILALSKNAYYAVPRGDIGIPDEALHVINPDNMDAIITDSIELRNQVMDDYSTAEMYEIMNTELRKPVYVIFIN